MTTSSRDEVLRRVRGAVGAVAAGADAAGADAADMTEGRLPAPAPVPRGYRLAGTRPRGDEALVELLVDRLEDYRAGVVRCADDDTAIGQAIAAALASREIEEAVVPSGLQPAWTQGIARVTVDSAVLDSAALDSAALDSAALDAIPAVVTGSTIAIAETGTIVLEAGPTCGRRAITLVPDVHICVVRRGDIVETVPEGLALVDPLRPLTFISGPSATSDIELTRVEGVHGPRSLVVVLAG